MMLGMSPVAILFHANGMWEEKRTKLSNEPKWATESDPTASVMFKT